MDKIIKNFIFLTVFLLCFVPAVSFATELSFQVEKNTFGQGEVFLVEVYLDRKDVPINAIEGIVHFPDELLILKEIRDGSSAVNFWVDKPSKVSPDSVGFSGITAGGFAGTRNFLFSMVFQTKISGKGSLRFDGVRALRNDGLGTKASVNINELTLLVSAENAIVDSKNLLINDDQPPEAFVPFVASDQTIYDGKYFLVFSTQDKGGGVDHYEIREGYRGEYKTAESPYLLENQALDGKIYVKAVDKNSNEVIVVVKAQNHAWYQYLLIIVIIILIGILIYKKVWLNFIKKQR